jgi:hypothetical protein
MIRDDDCIQTCFDGGMGNILMGSGPVRIACMHVQVDDDFVHETSFAQELAKDAVPDGVRCCTNSIATDDDASRENYQVDGSSSTRV